MSGVAVCIPSLMHLRLWFGMQAWSDPSGVFLLPQSIKVCEMIQQCWSDEVYIHGLAHRFWKLTLQLLSRYSRCLIR